MWRRWRIPTRAITIARVLTGFPQRPRPSGRPDVLWITAPGAARMCITAGAPPEVVGFRRGARPFFGKAASGQTSQRERPPQRTPASMSASTPTPAAWTACLSVVRARAHAAAVRHVDPAARGRAGDGSLKLPRAQPLRAPVGQGPLRQPDRRARPGGRRRRAGDRVCRRRRRGAPPPTMRRPVAGGAAGPRPRRAASATSRPLKRARRGSPMPAAVPRARSSPPASTARSRSNRS